MLTRHRCYEQGHSNIYGTTSWLVHGQEASLWEFGIPPSAFWYYVNLVKEMQIRGDDGASQPRPAESPALRRLIVHLRSSTRQYKLFRGGVVLKIPVLVSSDQEISTWIMTCADYRSFIEPSFEAQRNFTISIEVVFRVDPNLDICSTNRMVSNRPFQPHNVPLLLLLLTYRTSSAMSILTVGLLAALCTTKANANGSDYPRHNDLSKPATKHFLGVIKDYVLIFEQYRVLYPYF